MKKGLNIKCWFRAILKTGAGDATGNNGGIADLVINYSQNGGTPATMTGATATWDDDMEQWLLDGPTSFVPTWGVIDITIKGSNIYSVNIRLAVTKMNGEQIITGYSFDPDNSQITIEQEGYTDISIKEILSIYNVTLGTWLYNSLTRRHGAQPGLPWTKFYKIESIVNGVITYTAPNASGTTNQDILQIIVNKTS